MAFVTGVILIDAPASALNNMGAAEGARTDNTMAVKQIKTPDGTYPYVSAQAIRFWLRNQLEHGGAPWKAAPVYREGKVAYSDGNPIQFWDDDLFGYMRAASKKTDAKKDLAATPCDTEITRIAPFRVGTFVSTAPVRIVDDFGTMTRKGDPVPHEHQFYRAHLKGLFSIDLTCVGTFFTGEAKQTKSGIEFEGRVGYRNLDSNRLNEAKKALEEVTVRGQSAYRLGLADRRHRVAALLRAMADLVGGAKQTLHYTDVTPAVAIVAVTRGGNHPFQRLFTANPANSRTVFRTDVLREVRAAYKDEILSDIHVGWATGFLDEDRSALASAVADAAAGLSEAPRVLAPVHPRNALIDLARAIDSGSQAAKWFD